MPTDLPPDFKGTAETPGPPPESGPGFQEMPLPHRLTMATILLSIAAVTGSTAIWLCAIILRAAGLGG